MDLASARRFTDRVADYVRYRPDYPAAATGLIIRELGIAPGSTVIDVGAGTGLLTKPLAATGADVIALDPNEDMLAAARDHLAEFGDHVQFVTASAEATGLADHSVDAVVMGQTFHWVDPVATRTELLRILRPGARVALVWNVKGFGDSDFLARYEELLTLHVPEFADVRHEKTGEEAFDAFFAGGFELTTFPHQQLFDWDGVVGRVMSSSYAPKDGAVHELLVRELRALFAEFSVDGKLVWPYTTTVYVGSLKENA